MPVYCACIVRLQDRTIGVVQSECIDVRHQIRQRARRYPRRGALADGYSDTVPFDFERFGDCLDNAIGQRAGIVRAFYPALDDRKFVATQTRDRVALTDTTAKPFGYDSQELVTERVAQQIVDLLEAIEVDAKQRDAAAIPHPHEDIVDTELQQRAVRKAGHRIVMRHMADAGLGLASLSDPSRSSRVATWLPRPGGRGRARDGPRPSPEDQSIIVTSAPACPS